MAVNKEDKMEQGKRQAGQIIDDKKKKGKKIWLVLSESEGKEGVGYKHKCGTEIQGKLVTHPIWDGPFACSGSGQVRSETVPFCPQCEIEPNSSGTPIDVPFPGIATKS